MEIHGHITMKVSCGVLFTGSDGKYYHIIDTRLPRICGKRTIDIQWDRVP